MAFAASIELSNLISCGPDSVSCCDMLYLIVVTSHENYGLVQQSFKDLLSIFLACAYAACFSFMFMLELGKVFSLCYVCFVTLSLLG